MYLLSMCDKSYIVQILLIIKTFFKIACAVVPIIVIIATIINLFKAITSGKDDDLKDTFKITVRRIIGGLVVFFLPTILSAALNNFVSSESTTFLGCFESASAEKVAKLKAKEEAESEAARKQKEAEDLRLQQENERVEAQRRAQRKVIFEEARERFRRNQNSVSIANGEMFTPETKRIIEAHANDFNYRNFNQVMNQYGGMQGYAKHIGGVFGKYYGKQVPGVECASDFQEISEYVYGWMYLIGFDYYNGEKYCKWGGECGGSQAAPDAFYPSGVKETGKGLSSPKSDFDKLIAGTKKLNMTTNCNWSVDMVYYKAGLFGGPGQPSSSASFRSMGNKYKIISDPRDLQVGDIMHFFRASIDRNNPSTWNNWYHVAYIGEVNKTEGYVIGYDGGSYFTNNKNFKWKGDIASGKMHGTKNWAAVRIADIKQTC